MKKSIVFKPYDGMAAKVGDIVYSAYVPKGEKAAVSGKVVYTGETELVVDWGRPKFGSLASFSRVTAERHLNYGVEQFLVNGFAVPAPLEKDPGEGHVVYVADPTLSEWYGTLIHIQIGRVLRALMIARGLAHGTAAAAIAHAKAMVGVDPTTRESLDDAYDELP